MSYETVKVIREILPGVHEDALHELRTLIAQSLGIPSPSELADRRLGLLAEIAVCTPARLPLGEEYETARAERAVDGEDWPTCIDLSETYGSWLGAVCTATKPSCLRSKERSASREARPAAGLPYTRRDALLAIARCKSEIGKWPTQRDYTQWRRVVRHTSRLHGFEDPRTPDVEQLRRLYASWSCAKAAAQRRLEHE